nr:Ig-like domain-containing protein [Oscillospiraceae bacterium]
PELKNNIKFIWASSDSKVATITQEGVLHILSHGAAKITVSYGDLSSYTNISIDKIQDYTSFIVINNSDIDMPNSVIGYKKGEYWIKVADLGNLKINQSSKEFIINEFIDYDLYLFTDYISPRKTEVAFRLKENRMNIFSFPDDFRGTPVDHLDPKEYPH